MRYGDEIDGRDSTLIRKAYMNCPLCDKTHEVEERKRTTSSEIKGEEELTKRSFIFALMRMRTRMNLYRDQWPMKIF